MKKILIVGGGIIALYTALRIKEKRPEYEVNIFEKTARFGGMFYTNKWNNFNIEFGLTYIKSSIQPNFIRLLKELDIELIESKSNLVHCNLPNVCEMSMLEKVALLQSDEEEYSPAYILIKLGVKQILGDKFEEICKLPKTKRDELIMNEFQYEDKYLHEYGIWNLLSKELSKHALDFIKSHTMYCSVIMMNPNAANTMSMFLDIICDKDENLLQMKRGSSDLIYKMVEKLKYLGVQFFLNHNIVQVDNVTNEDVKIITKHNEIYYGNKVILTIPPKGYESIHGLNQAVKDHIHKSMILFETCKIVCIFDNPVFDHSNIPKPNLNVNQINCREISYKYDEFNKYGMITMLCDQSTMYFWSSYLKQNHAIPNDVTKYDMLKTNLQSVLKQLFPESESKILYYNLIDWSSKRDRTCGYYLLRPSYKHSILFEKCNNMKNIYIAGCMWNINPFFIETSLEVSEKIISKIV